MSDYLLCLMQLALPCLSHGVVMHHSACGNDVSCMDIAAYIASHNLSRCCMTAELSSDMIFNLHTICLCPRIAEDICLGDVLTCFTVSLQPWKALGNGLKDYLDSSVRSGKAYNDSSGSNGSKFYDDKSGKGGSRFYDDTSARSGRAYYNESSARAGRAYYGDTSAHAGHVYEPILEHDPSRQSVEGWGGGAPPTGGQQTQSPFANVNGNSATGPPSKKVYKLTPLT